MKYMLQVYFNGAQSRLEQLPEAERAAIVQEYIAFFESPDVKDGNQLQPPSTAATLRIEDGNARRDPGPFTESGEPLGGYYLVEADVLDGALALASRIPAARMGGAIEVRPVVER
jgi:hypothetical protein